MLGPTDWDSVHPTGCPGRRCPRSLERKSRWPARLHRPSRYLQGMPSSTPHAHVVDDVVASSPIDGDRLGGGWHECSACSACRDRGVCLIVVDMIVADTLRWVNPVIPVLPTAMAVAMALA